MSNAKRVDYRPWEDEQGGKRKRGKLRGVPYKTAIKSRVISMPSAESHEYLNIFVLLKEKERLEQYGDLLSQRHESVIDEWNALKDKLIELEKDLPRMTEGSSRKEVGKQNKRRERKMKNMKIIDWNY